MNELLIEITVLVLSYLLGAVPFGFLIAKTKGIDIRTVGSKNVGATNVFRCVSKPLGVIVFFLDAAKGFLPVFIASRILTPDILPAGHGVPLSIACAVCTILGHNWPVYLKFRGGKGVATSAGALLGLAPLSMIIGLLIWILFFTLFRYVSLSSIAASLALIIAPWFVYGSQSLLLPATLTSLGLLSIIRHHANIKRLIDGTENRVTGSGKTSSPASADTSITGRQ
jgi:acyl phosphate:glycerol-3-phosphate acyltransferase